MDQDEQALTEKKNCNIDEDGISSQMLCFRIEKNVDELLHDSNT